MSDPSVQKQMTRSQTASTNNKPVAIGANAASLTPPKYGVDFIDRKVTSLAKEDSVSPISEDNIARMHADVEFIVARLKQQILLANEEQEIVDRIRTWSIWDQYYAVGRWGGSPFMDKFLELLRNRRFSRRTARVGFGLAGEEWLYAYDGLFYELEGDRLEQFRSLVAKSQKQGTTAPETEQMESVYSFIGKREIMGLVGFLKGLGLVLAGLADTAIWLQWKTTGAPLVTLLERVGIKGASVPPEIVPFLTINYEELAKIIGNELGVDPIRIKLSHHLLATLFPSVCINGIFLYSLPKINATEW